MDIIRELFEARCAIPPNHTKSIQICITNRINIPVNAQINIASKINLNPIVNHHNMKNGFNALSKTPVTNGPCFGFVVLFFFSCNTILICIAANTKSVIAPKIEISILNSGNVSKENTPIPNKITKGNSTSVWPIAILIPDFAPSRNPYDMFAVNSGPGAITPDAEITITNIANSKICVISFTLFSYL